MKFDETVLATVLSVSGALLVASSDQVVRLAGFVIWITSNLIWVYYFKRTLQYNPMTLFIIYLFISLFGVYNNI